MLEKPLNLLKKNPSLIPLFVFVGFGATGAIYITLRTYLTNPEITYNKKKNPEPWNEYRNKQYKLYSPGLKKEDCISQAPEY